MAAVDAPALTAVEATDLHDLEETIEKGLAGFVEVGRALERIRDKKLYREKFGTFEGYLKERWGLSRAHAYRQIEAAAVVGTLSPTGDTPAPVSERVARELAPVKDDPEKLRQTWDNVVELHGPKPTAGQVREVVVERDRQQDREPRRELSPARMKRLEKHAADVLGMASTFCSIEDGWLTEHESNPTFDRARWLKELRAGRRGLGRLIRTIEERGRAES